MKKTILLLLCMLLSTCQFDPVYANHRLIDVARQVEQKYALPEGLLESVCYTESHWNNVPGRHGEVGVCQVKPATVRMVCKTCEPREGNLILGSRSKFVQPLQILLKGEGLYTGAIDGIFGPKTYAAVTKYQARTGLKADGIVGPRTWTSLFKTEFPNKNLADQLQVPERNIEYAGMVLSWLSEYLDTNNTAILAAAYNGGPGHPVVTYMLKIEKRHNEVMTYANY